MDIMLLRLFQRQAALQCKYLLMACNELNAALQQRNIERGFYALQNALNAAANISKTMWGEGGRRTEARKVLRDSIGISDDSPLREMVMRNHFEHFDERLERWWEQSERHNVIDMAIGPQESVRGADLIDCFRWFDPQTTDLYFWGDEFNLRRLVDEAQTILPKLEAEANKPHFDPKWLRPRA